MTDMFESMLGGGGGSPIDVLNALLDSTDIEMKTDVNIQQVKILMQIKWHVIIRKEENKDKPALELFEELMEYYLKLMVSIGRKSRIEIIDGIKQMKESLMEQQLVLQNMMGGAKK